MDLCVSENIASGYITLQDAVAEWYGEYDPLFVAHTHMEGYEREKGGYGRIGVSELSNLLWYSINQVGCAQSHTLGEANNILYVCRYYSNTTTHTQTCGGDTCSVANTNGCFKKMLPPRDTRKDETACLHEAHKHAESMGLELTVQANITPRVPDPGPSIPIMAGAIVCVFVVFAIICASIYIAVVHSLTQHYPWQKIYNTDLHTYMYEAEGEENTHMHTHDAHAHTEFSLNNVEATETHTPPHTLTPPKTLGFADMVRKESQKKHAHM
eukprot:GDKI01026163.1.p1 GENE.GDKI01026163.1~~GDKI01026163.1.p1  ORF type:complete len:269 (-),score=76.31 GDKI01026163.1:73-879(-)